jgi:membrane fusion protein, multidrug efflux system
MEPGQVVARLEPQNEMNTLRAAQANLAAAHGQLTQAQNHFDRQDTLLKQGWTTRANHDQATQALQTAQSQVDATEAQLKSAHDLVSFTELRADAPGVLTAIGPAAGEVVQAGQMIVRLARKDGRDAVFDVPARLIRSAPADPQIIVSLTDDPKVTAHGRVRKGWDRRRRYRAGRSQSPCLARLLLITVAPCSCFSASSQGHTPGISV